VSVLIKEQIADGVYMYYMNGQKISEDNLTHILFDVDTMGTLKDYTLSDNLEYAYVRLEA
jgi:hypothetical protein